MNKIYSYDEAVALLTSQGKFHINLGLERITKILDLMENPQDNLKYIHVAGTNGKGSTSAIIASILDKANMKVGLYTSPHIFDYTERIKINNDEILKNDFAKYVFEICDLAQDNQIDLTEFEILTAIMFKYFYDNNVEVVVLETGLGGQYDATNVIKENLCAVITHIALDHTDRLGKTLPEIAKKKAGIIKPNCHVITSEGYEAIKDRADECNSLLLMISPYENTANLSLKGNFQQSNLSLALATIRLVFPKISQQVINEGISCVKHQCRFQYIKSKNLIVDAAHNPDGAKALRESLDFYFPNIKRRFIFGALNNKDYSKMMDILFSKNDEICFYNFNNKNSCTAEHLQEFCEYNSTSLKSIDDINFSNEILTIICGSFYMINEIITKETLNQ
ncbi:MAG: folylpolyglutamate synthase/dihydrofolate synthase family protein [Candidatus Gastranaerophilales bacterium]